VGTFLKSSLLRGRGPGNVPVEPLPLTATSYG